MRRRSGGGNFTPILRHNYATITPAAPLAMYEKVFRGPKGPLGAPNPKIMKNSLFYFLSFVESYMASGPAGVIVA